MRINGIKCKGLPLLDKGESFVAQHRTHVIKGSTFSCRMPDPLEEGRRWRRGLPDIMEDIKKY